MAVKITGQYRGSLGTEMVHEESGSILRTAAPKDNAGDGSAFSPTDLLAASLASCVMTTIAIVAERDGVDLGGAHFSVAKHMSAAPRRVALLELDLHLPAHLDEDQRRKYEAFAHKCPVAQSLLTETGVEARFHYDA
jgi:putative redox protein